jgi:hypothetical protein
MGRDTPYFYRVAVGLDRTIYLVDKYGILYALKRGKLVRIFVFFKCKDVAATYRDIWVCSEKGEVWTADTRRWRFSPIKPPRYSRTYFESIAVGYETETVWTVGKDESLWKYGESDDHGDDDGGHHGGY